MRTFATIFLCLTAFAASGTTPVSPRMVERHTVVSPHDPNVEITLPSRATYVGTDRWVMQRYADQIELFAFVEVTGDRQVQKLYWVQFEAYLPSRPELKHAYASQRHVTLGGMDFLVDAWVTSGTDNEGPDSDSAHLKKLLGAAGYTLPRSTMSVRLVHLMDGNRKELMYIYREDTAPTGYSAADLKPGGGAHSHWQRIAAGLIERAERNIVFH
jgi:hypothetical protein